MSVFQDVINKNYIKRLQDLLDYVGPKYGAANFWIDEECHPVLQMSSSGIIGDRYIGNITFARRALLLLQHIKTDYPGDPGITDIIDDLISDTQVILDYQIQTCTDEEELTYLNNL